jgi:hypothetical protein
MKISTISFELQGEKMAINSSQRIDYILNAVLKEKPDILLTSGYSLDTNDDIEILIKKLIEHKNTSNILIEVKYDKQILNEGHPANNGSTHCLYFINNKNKLKRLGSQIFAQSNEVSGKTKEFYTKIFDKILHNRIFTVNDKKIIALCCGEINVIQGRDNIKFISEESKKIIKSCDIILNPTHDCMANYGTLKAKRVFLSKLKTKGSTYVSSSNWNTKKIIKDGNIRKQNKQNSFMQNIYHNGKKLKTEEIVFKNECLLNSVIIKAFK